MIPRAFLTIGTDEDRFDIGKPFVRDGYLWATDRRILIRAPQSLFSFDDLVPYAPGDRCLPDLSKIATWWSADRAAPIPLMRGCQLMSVCPHCLAAWDGCWPLSPDRIQTACLVCDGDGWIRNRIPVNHGAVSLMGYYTALLESFGVQTIEPAAVKPAKNAVRFVIGDIEGLLMPCDPSAGEAAA